MEWSKSDLQREYSQRLPLFSRLRDNVEEAIGLFVKEASIPLLAVTGRVKEFTSFLEKAERKKYAKPFDDNEDFVGVRVILYYPDDVEKVAQIIDKEFQVQTSENKTAALGINQFGYRSTHKIVRIPVAWSNAPNYRGIGDIKCEIQIRTILMHAWAEVEHKLQYKNEIDVPTELRRKLFLLSAKFEEADDQFKSIRDEADRYKEKIIIDLERGANTAEFIELNVDSLRAYLVRKFPDRNPEEEPAAYSELLKELAAVGYASIQQLDQDLDRSSTAFLAYEQANPPTGHDQFSRVGVARVSLLILSDVFLDASIKKWGFVGEFADRERAAYRAFRSMILDPS